jgi:hypothetical protein
MCATRVPLPPLQRLPGAFFCCCCFSNSHGMQWGDGCRDGDNKCGKDSRRPFLKKKKKQRTNAVKNSEVEIEGERWPKDDEAHHPPLMSLCCTCVGEVSCGTGKKNKGREREKGKQRDREGDAQRRDTAKTRKQGGPHNRGCQNSVQSPAHTLYKLVRTSCGRKHERQHRSLLSSKEVI